MMQCIILLVIFIVNKVLLILVAPIAIYLFILILIFKNGYDEYLELSNISNQSENIINETHSH